MVEHRLAKARAAGSNPVSCFFYLSGRSGENRTSGFFIYSEVLVRTNSFFILEISAIFLMIMRAEKVYTFL